MPKCRECDNERGFLVAILEFELVTYKDDKVIDQEAVNRERYDHKYSPECADCGSTDIEGEI